MRILSLLTILALAGTCHAASEKVSAAVLHLKKAIAEENAKNPDPGGSRQAMAASMAARLNPALESTSAEARDYLADALSQISAVYTSGAVIDAVAALQAAAQEDQQAQEKQTRDQLEAGISAARQAVEGANSAQDLDKTIQELTILRKPYNSGSYRAPLRKNYEDVAGALLWVNRWQDYLAAKEAGNNQAASNALQQLANMEGGMLMPRSRVLKLAEEARQGRDDGRPQRRPAAEVTADVDKAISGLKTLDDIEPVARQLRQIATQEASAQGYGEALQPLRNLIGSLEQINRCYQDYKAGLPANLPFNAFGDSGAEPAAPALSKLRAEMLLLVIPRYVGAPEGTSAKPGERPDQLLSRLENEASARADYGVAQKAAELRRMLASRNNPYQRMEPDAFGALIAARNQEAAGQYMFAVISYQAALGGNSAAIPAKLIGEHLAALQSEHPKEYEAGVERYLLRGGMDAGRFPGGGMPGPNPRGQGTLTVPAAPVPSPAAEKK